MRHDWFFEVLDDLLDYCSLNGFPRTMQQIEIAIGVAKEEMGVGTSPPDEPKGQGPGG